MTTTYRSPLCRYIERIRNVDKRLYARAYVAWLSRGQLHEDEPEPEHGRLSYMVAQAVRHNVQDLVRL